MDQRKKVIDVAKEFRTSTAKIIDELKKGGFDANDHLSEVSDEMYAFLKSKFGKEEEGVVFPDRSSPQAGGTQAETPNKGGSEDVDLGDIIDLLNQELDHIVESEIAQISGEAEAEVKEEKTVSEKESTETKDVTDTPEDQKPVETTVGAEPSNGETADTQISTAEEKETETKEQTQRAESEEKDKQDDTEITRVKAPKLEGLRIKGKINVERIASSRRAKKTRKTTEQKKEEDKKAKPKKVEARFKKRERKPTHAKRLTEEDIRRIGRGDSMRFRRKDKKTEPSVVDQKAIDKRMRELQAEQNRARAKAAEYKKKKKEKIKQRKLEEELMAKEGGRTLEVAEFITVADLASMMGVSPIDVITKFLDELGEAVTINQRLEAPQIELIAEQYGFQVHFKSPEEEWKEDEEEKDNPEDLQPRAPVVTVMTKARSARLPF